MNICMHVGRVSPYLPACIRRMRTASVSLSHLFPRKGKLPRTASANVASSDFRSSRRARKSRVFTVSGCTPRISAVSSTVNSWMSRRMNVGRKISGKESTACSSKMRVSARATCVSGLSTGCPPGNPITVAPCCLSASAAWATVRRRRSRPRPSLITIRVSQVPRLESPRNPDIAAKSARITLLEDIFCFGIVRNYCPRHTVKALIVALHQLSKGGLFTRVDPVDQSRFGDPF